MIRTLFGLLLALAASALLAADVSEKPQLADNAPDSHVVQKGDTLWAISGIFLKQPWRWPELWRLNQEQIRNPHLIYPGQVVVLDRTTMTLSVGRTVSSTEVVGAGASGNDKLSPRVYSTPSATPISSISLEAIRPFLTEPLVDDSGDKSGVPTIVGIQDKRVVAGPGDAIFAKNLSGDVTSWNIYRGGKAIKHPETGETLGFEAEFVGSAQVVSAVKGNVAAELKVVSARQVISTGDHLVPTGKSELVAVPPHAPAAGTSAVVASVYGGVGAAGKNSVVAISVGKSSGIEAGHILALNRNRGTITYRNDGRSEQHALPDARLGLVYVFRVFNKLSYALVLEAGGAVYVGDKLTAP